MPSGSCACGDVRFDAAVATLAAPDACHCTTCRKHSGHYFVSTDVPKSAVTIHGEDKLTWFRSSEKVERGFCRRCGSSLFFKPLFKDWLGIAMGAFDDPTATKIHIHIFCAEKGDYYTIDDGAPQMRTIPVSP